MTEITTSQSPTSTTETLKPGLKTGTILVWTFGTFFFIVSAMFLDELRETSKMRSDLVRAKQEIAKIKAADRRAQWTLFNERIGVPPEGGESAPAEYKENTQKRVMEWLARREGYVELVKDQTATETALERKEAWRLFHQLLREDLWKTKSAIIELGYSTSQ